MADRHLRLILNVTIDTSSPSAREEGGAQGPQPPIPEAFASSLPLEVLSPVAARSTSFHVPLAAASLPVTVLLYLVVRPSPPSAAHSLLAMTDATVTDGRVRRSDWEPGSHGGLGGGQRGSERECRDHLDKLCNSDRPLRKVEMDL